MPTDTKIELVKGGKRVDGTFIPNTPATGTITSDTLKPAPSFSVTQPKPATQLDGLGAMAQAGNDAFSETLKASADETRKNADAARAQYTKALQDTPGEAQLTNTEYAKEVDPAAAELSDINQQIIEEEHAKQRRLQALDKNPQGLFGGALEQEKQRVTDESNARQADLSVIQLAKQGRYDSAVARADRAVQAKLEARQNLIDALKVNYEDNKDLFNTAEQRSFETLLSDRNRKLDKEAADLKQISDLSLNALTNGAPASVAMQMRQAKTVEEAFAIGGGYVDMLDRQLKNLQMANIQSQIAERAAAGNANGTINGKAQTVAQSTANGYADRLLSASRIFDQIEGNFTGNLAYGNFLPNQLQSPERQQFEQAKRNFINAVLRRESGASILPSEYASAEQQYFAQPGDDAATLKQKTENRNTVINNFYREANVFRPVLPGDIIEADGKRYKVGDDGQELTEITS